MLMTLSVKVHVRSRRRLTIFSKGGLVRRIVAKSLARRLQRILHGVVVGRQSSFLGGRNLLHNALIANEVVEEARRKKKKCLIFKVDYEKTYDSVS